jgi:hypothetical protein
VVRAQVLRRLPRRHGEAFVRKRVGISLAKKNAFAGNHAESMVLSCFGVVWHLCAERAGCSRSLEPDR